MKNGSEKRKVVLGITGSIAAYKAAELTRYLTTRGYDVRVVMSDAAEKFIAPLTFESLTGHAVTRSFWEETQPGAIGHIALADWADLLVIAPASADFLAKLTYGFAESPLLAVALATKAPILCAPAMNVNMFDHPQTQANIQALRARGVSFVDPDYGDLACGWKGRGRLAHHREIFFHIRRALTQQDFAGRRVIITTGPTREAIDPVRFISNRSSGRMGIALAGEAYRRGACVTLIHGVVSGPLNVPRDVRCVAVTSALEMQSAVVTHTFGENGEPSADLVIMAAAVADCRPQEIGEHKIKNGDLPPHIALTRNPDILATIGERKGAALSPTLVGFAVETGDVAELLSEVRRKMSQKNADLMVGNLASDSFDQSTNRVWIVNRAGHEEEVSTTYKTRVATRIFDAIAKL
jgi:phosphopantothenoylcysteine decarboxylase/phosphopantothenate--cysteine ligase